MECYEGRIQPLPLPPDIGNTAREEDPSKKGKFEGLGITRVT